MIGPPRAIRIWAYPKPADLRKGYNGLFGLVSQDLGRDPLSGEVVIFLNKKRSSCKLLYWDGTGLCIFMKRLERGRFANIWRSDSVLELTSSELSLFVEGCVLVGKQVLSPPVCKFGVA